MGTSLSSRIPHHCFKSLNFIPVLFKNPGVSSSPLHQKILMKQVHHWSQPLTPGHAYFCSGFNAWRIFLVFLGRRSKGTYFFPRPKQGLTKPKKNQNRLQVETCFLVTSSHFKGPVLGGNLWRFVWAKRAGLRWLFGRLTLEDVLSKNGHVNFCCPVENLENLEFSTVHYIASMLKIYHTRYPCPNFLWCQPVFWTPSHGLPIMGHLNPFGLDRNQNL